MTSKYRRELFLTVMVGIALTIIIAAAILLRDLTGLSVTAAGVFVAVIGVGLYDQWQDAELAREHVKNRR